VSNKVKFEQFVKVINERSNWGDDLIRVTIRTINPDQTGLMTHSEVMRKDLEIFWMGYSAIARAWVEPPQTSVKSLEDDRSVVEVTMHLTQHDQPNLIIQNEIPRDKLAVYWLGVNAVARTWATQPDGLILPEVNNA
jgi:hypothetical protein